MSSNADRRLPTNNFRNLLEIWKSDALLKDHIDALPMLMLGDVIVHSVAMLLRELAGVKPVT